MAPASLFLQRHVRTRFDLLRPEVEDRVVANQATQKMHHDRHSRQRDFFVGQRVMVRNLRPGPQWIPGTIIERRGPVTYLVQVARDRIWKRHIDHLNKTTDTPQNQTTLLRPTIKAEGPAETPVSLPDPDASSLADTVPAPSTSGVPEPTPESDSPTDPEHKVPLQTPSSPPTPTPAISPPDRRYPQRTRRRPDRYQAT